MKVIAEGGINHMGDLQLARILANRSKRAGADIVKFQTFWNLGRLKKYELTRSTHLTLKKYCYEIGIEFMSTPHTLDAIDFLDSLVKMHKVASPFLTNKEFIMRVDEMAKPILLSTGSLQHENGMATFDEIKTTLDWIKHSEVTLMHCCSKYPCKEPHYERIDELRKEFNLPVGLSDHSQNIKIDVDVPYLEKHIMLHHVNSIDKAVSLYPEEFKEMVKYVKKERN